VKALAKIFERRNEHYLLTHSLKSIAATLLLDLSLSVSAGVEAEQHDEAAGAQQEDAETGTSVFSVDVSQHEDPPSAFRSL
jgi:hypothetical protein